MALNNVPLTGQNLLQTRDAVNQNFNLTNTGFAINHVELGIVDAGKHKYVQFPQQSGDPGTAATEVAIYAKNGTGGTTLWYQPPSSGTAYEITAKLANANGWTKLPSGILLQWGTIAISSVDTPVPFTIPFSTAVYNIQLTEVVNANARNWVQVYTPSTTVVQFVPRAWTESSNRANTNAYYFAIGI